MTTYRGNWTRHADTAGEPVQTLNVSETEGRTTNATSARTRAIHSEQPHFLDVYFVLPCTLFDRAKLKNKMKYITEALKNRFCFFLFF